MCMAAKIVVCRHAGTSALCPPIIMIRVERDKCSKYFSGGFAGVLGTVIRFQSSSIIVESLDWQIFRDKKQIDENRIPNKQSHTMCRKTYHCPLLNRINQFKFHVCSLHKILNTHTVNVYLCHCLWALCRMWVYFKIYMTLNHRYVSLAVWHFGSGKVFVRFDSIGIRRDCKVRLWLASYLHCSAICGQWEEFFCD